MNLDTSTALLLRRGWLAVVLAIVLGAAAYAVAATRTPVYEAESRVAIQAAKPADLGQTQAINGLLRSFAADVVTTELAREVAATLGASDVAAEAEAIKAQASAEANEGTREVRIRYHSTDPAQAERVADTLASAFVARRTLANLQLDTGDRVFATKRDATTHHQWWPRKKLLTAAGVVAGLALGGLIALLLEYEAAGVVRRPADLAALGVGAWLGSVPVSGAQRARSQTRRRAGLRRAAAALWPVALGAAVGVGAALLFTALRPTEYRARTRVAIEPARTSDWGQTQAIREILRGYSEDIGTRNMADDVSRLLALDLPAERMLELLRVAPNEETYEVWIDVLHPDPATAEAVSRAWGQVFTEARATANQELDARDRIYARIREPQPAELYAPKRGTNALAGAVIGALVGAAVALALRVGRPRTTPDELSAGAPILGLLPAHTQGASPP